MALHRPRRIFRGSIFDLPAFGAGDVLRGVALIMVAVTGIAAGVALFGETSDLSGRVPALSGAVASEPRLVAAEPQLVAVVDGATLRLDEIVVQLRGVAAPARGRNCPNGQAGGYDCGAAATLALADLVRGRRVACRLDGREHAGLVQGVCEAGGAELNRALVAAGWARADTPALRDTEAAARAEKVGLWRDGANPGF